MKLMIKMMDLLPLKIKNKMQIPMLSKERLELGHKHICGCRARCLTCRVLVSDGLENCSPRNKKEAMLARTKGVPLEIRLACQTTAKNNITLKRLILDDEDISQAIHEGRANIAKDNYKWKKKFTTHVKGKELPIVVYEPDFG